MRFLRYIPAVALTLACLVLLGLLVATVADANPRVERYRAIADQTFPGAEARCGTVRIQYTSAPLPSRNDGSHPEAIAFIDECLVMFNSSYAASAPRQVLCATLAHEYGHLDRSHSRAGYNDEDHSNDPNSVMYGRFLAVNRVPSCNRLAWIESEIERLTEWRTGTAVDRMRDLRSYRRAVRRRARPAVRISRVRAVNRRIARFRTRVRRVEARIAAHRVELGP